MLIWENQSKLKIFHIFQIFHISQTRKFHRVRTYFRVFFHLKSETTIEFCKFQTSKEMLILFLGLSSLDQIKINKHYILIMVKMSNEFPFVRMMHCLESLSCDHCQYSNLHSVGVSIFELDL